MCSLPSCTSPTIPLQPEEGSVVFLVMQDAGNQFLQLEKKNEHRFIHSNFRRLFSAHIKFSIDTFFFQTSQVVCHVFESMQGYLSTLFCFSGQFSYSGMVFICFPCMLPVYCATIYPPDFLLFCVDFFLFTTHLSVNIFFFAESLLRNKWLGMVVSVTQKSTSEVTLGLFSYKDTTFC